MPISLLSSLSKVTKNFIQTRLEDFTVSNQILLDFQHDFRGSCWHQLRRLTKVVSDKLNWRQSAAMLLLDVRQAIERLWYDELTFKLIHLEYSSYLVHLVSGLISYRLLSSTCWSQHCLRSFFISSRKIFQPIRKWLSHCTQMTSLWYCLVRPSRTPGRISYNIFQFQ